MTDGRSRSRADNDLPNLRVGAACVIAVLVTLAVTIGVAPFYGPALAVERPTSPTAGPAALGAAEPGVSVRSTSTEYLEEPIGVDTAQPRFGWVLGSEGRDAVQVAYQVQVATSPSALDRADDLVWDSGRVAADDSVGVEYAGEPLRSSTRYVWRVRVWSAPTVVSAWSDPTTFETGLLSADDWVARWIAPATSASGGSYLRTSVSLPDGIRQARLYVSGRGNYERGPDGQGICCQQQFGLARGIYEAYVDGRRVGDAQLESTQVDTRVRALYRTYDVTSLVSAGENVIGMMTGEDSDVLAQLRVVTADGRVLDFGTDGSWVSAPGPVVRAHRYHGETYDARKEIAGWSTPAVDAATWRAVRVSNGGTGRLDSATFEPMRVVATHEPVAVSSPASGVYVLDFGTNMTGWTRLSLDLPAGTTVTLKHGERLSSAGRVDNGAIGAQQTNRYTAAGGPVTWEPSFVYAGFRWVEVTGLPSAPKAGTIVAREVHNDVRPTGTFSVSNDLLNRLHRADLQTQVNGLHEVPEDTPTREKRGWMADAHIAAEAVINNYGMDAFYSNWVEEMRSAQQPDGRVPDIVPAEPSDGWQTRSDPAWAVAHVLIPSYLRERYADTRVLAQHYASMLRYLHYVDTTTRGDLLTSPVNTWGNDWLAVESTDSVLFRTGFYIWALQETARAARLLDRPNDADDLEARAAQVTSALNSRFLDPVDESYGESQFANAFPLFLRIVPAAHVDGVLRNLVHDVVQERGDHFTGGLPGIKYIPEALAMYGRSDVVLDVVTNTSYPGWGYMLDHGPGTIWEDWKGASSLDHPMFTSIDNWLYRSVLGIDQAPGSAGYHRSVIAPQVMGRLDSGAGSVETPYGTLASSWEHVDGQLVQTVTVPVNTTAEVTVPARSARDVLEGAGSGYVRDAAGVHAVRETADGVVVTVGSGTYRFRTDPVLGMLGRAYDELTAFDARLGGPGVSAAAARLLARDVERVEGPVTEAIQARQAGAAPGDVRDLAADALGRLQVLGTHVDGLADDGEITPGAADELRGLLGAVRRELSTLVAGSSRITVSLEAAGEALPGSSFEARLRVTNGSARRMTRLAPQITAPSGWTVTPPASVPDTLAPGDAVVLRFGVDVPVTQPLREAVLDGELAGALGSTRVAIPARLPVQVTSPLSIDAITSDPRVLGVDDQGTDVVVSMTNRSDSTVTVTLNAVALPSGWSVPESPDHSIPAGASRVVRVPVERPTGGDAVGGTIVMAARGSAVEWARARTAAYVRGAGCAVDPTGEACLSEGFRLMHNFENDAEGWTGSENVSAVASVSSMANGPGVARLGSRLLEATVLPDIPANGWRSVSVNEPVPVPLGSANAFVAYVDGYGGAPSGPYQARLRLEDSAGRVLEATQAITPNSWNEVRVPLADWNGTDIAAVTISFRAAGDRAWRGNFQVDRVGLDATASPPDQSLDLARGRPVAARTSLSCCSWGAAGLVDGVRQSTTASRGYTSNPPSTDPDQVEWVQVDLGGVHTLGSVWLWPRTATAGEPLGNGGAGYPDSFTVQVSDDGESWTTLRSVTAAYADGTRGLGYPVTGAGRFVRVHVTKLGHSAPDEASQGYRRLQLAELEVYPQGA